ADYLYVPLINSMGFLVAGGLSLKIISKDFGIKFILPSFEAIKHQLKEGWYIFISTVSISLYTTSNTFILGLFTNNTIVGYYAAAEKIVKAIQGLLSPVSQTVYPHISKLASESKEKALNFIRKLLKIVSGISFIISLSIFIFANLIVNVILGPQYHQSIIILRILAFLPFIIFLTNMFGAQLLLPFNIKKLFTLSIIIPSFLHIALLLPVAYLHKEIGVAILVLFTETTILLFRIIGVYLFHKDIFAGIFYDKK
ncbi:MAG: oligosaccharide flippase family protein, partial [Candidatus Helarchaeota archaeon]